MRKPTNKKGSHGYGKFIDSFRKTKPDIARDGRKKSHKRKINKAGVDFAVMPPNKIVSKFSKEPKENNSNQSLDSVQQRTVSNTSFIAKAVAGTPGYDEWLAKFKAAMEAKRGGGVATAPKPYGKPGQSHQAILTEARGGNVETMNHPEAHNLRDAEGMSVLHHLARRGKSEVLTHEHAATTKDRLQRTPLHLLAERGVPDVLGHPQVSNTFDVLGNTPLHYLAQSKNPGVLDHPDVSTVRNLRGSTPLHSAAYAKIEGVQQHPDYGIVQDNAGRTPKHIFEGVSGQKPVEKGYKSFEIAFFGDLKKSDPTKKEYKYGELELCIEWKKGEIRKYGKNNEKDGKVMKADYGYIKGTTSPDGEEIDVYHGSHSDSTKVFLLLQKPTPYDVEHGFTVPEEKYMLGFNSIKEAEKAYKGSMPSKWFESIREIDQHYLYKKVRNNEIKKSEDVDKAISNQAVNASTQGIMTPPGIGEGLEKNVDLKTKKHFGRKELRIAQSDLKKDIDALPSAAAEQGSRQRGPVYSWEESNSIEKSLNKERLKLADELLKISKGNAFVGNAGFVARPHKMLTVEDAKKLPYNSGSEVFGNVKKRLAFILKSDVVSGGLMKYEKLNRIFRMKSRKDRLIDEQHEDNMENLKKVTKSLASIKRNIDNIPLLVFEIK